MFLIPILVYPFLYVFLFIFIFLPWFSEGSQTTAVFFLLSIFNFFQIVLAGLAISGVYYLIFRLPINAYLMIALLCVATGIIAGDYLLFGLMTKLKAPNQEIPLFGQQRDIALSCSALLSAICTGVIVRISSQNAI